MCRLLGAVTREPTTLTALLGPSLAGFTAMSLRHGDGWGAAWRAPDGSLDTVKGPEPAHASPAYAQALRETVSDELLVHLRWATLGLPVEARNTHPFSGGGLAFAHNGSIAPPAVLDGLLDPALAAARVGTTDSERYFLAVRSALLAGAPDPLAALLQTVRAVRELAPVSGRNALLLTPDALLAVCDHSSEPPRDEPEDYFAMAYRADADGVVVASSGWVQQGWTEIPNGSVLCLERGSGRVSLHPVSPAEEPVPAVGQPARVG